MLLARARPADHPRRPHGLVLALDGLVVAARTGERAPAAREAQPPPRPPEVLARPFFREGRANDQPLHSHVLRLLPPTPFARAEEPLRHARAPRLECDKAGAAEAKPHAFVAPHAPWLLAHAWAEAFDKRLLPAASARQPEIQREHLHSLAVCEIEVPCAWVEFVEHVRTEGHGRRVFALAARPVDRGGERDGNCLLRRAPVARDDEAEHGDLHHRTSSQQHLVDLDLRPAVRASRIVSHQRDDVAFLLHLLILIFLIFLILLLLILLLLLSP
mmetsp:Transcript_5780/g.12828  ORF Transcript_5780/g.12828 Transcript_5780/m.12828 type:complete len:273 (-) Transcript_5780:333-1151(-)